MLLFHNASKKQSKTETNKIILFPVTSNEILKNKFNNLCTWSIRRKLYNYQ